MPLRTLMMLRSARRLRRPAPPMKIIYPVGFSLGYIAFMNTSLLSRGTFIFLWATGLRGGLALKHGGPGTTGRVSRERLESMATCVGASVTPIQSYVRLHVWYVSQAGEPRTQQRRGQTVKLSTAQKPAANLGRG